MSSLPSQLETDFAKLKTELAYVRLHWASLSIVIVTAALAGAIVGHFL